MMFASTRLYISSGKTKISMSDSVYADEYFSMSFISISSGSAHNLQGNTRNLPASNLQPVGIRIALGWSLS